MIIGIKKHLKISIKKTENLFRKDSFSQNFWNDTVKVKANRQTIPTSAFHITPMDKITKVKIDSIKI